MTSAVPRMMVDCSVVTKWHIPSEQFVAEAQEMMWDGHHRAIELCGPDLLHAEVLNAFVGAFRRGRVSLTEAQDAVRDLLIYPFKLFKTTRTIARRAFALALQYQRHPYDCIYVALAEAKGLEFWTGDDKLYNGLHVTFPWIRRIADYNRRRPRR